MAKVTDTMRFAVLERQRVSRYKLKDMSAYDSLETTIMTAEAEKHSEQVHRDVKLKSPAE